MSKIKLMVTIDEENYKRIKDDVYDTHDIHRAIMSIRRGTPLDVLDKIFSIVHPLSIMSTDKLEHEAIMQIAEMLEPLCLPESEDEG